MATVTHTKGAAGERLRALRERLTAEHSHADAPAAAAAASESARSTTTNPSPTSSAAGTRTFAIETYGCQMNVSDTEVVRSILLSNGWSEWGADAEANQPEAVGGPGLTLLNTCAIRDNAEQKIWQRLHLLNKERRQRRGRAGPRGLVGVLGCMAERLKTRLLEEAPGGVVDLVVGPDAYREVPRLAEALRGGAEDKAVDVALSLEETYADIAPVRVGDDGVGAFVSVMRGCNNMCSYCVVPFTRGRERSRPLESIMDEVRSLIDGGYKEITLLGQNVNSYHDRSLVTSHPPEDTGSLRTQREQQQQQQQHLGYVATPGFRNMFSERARGGSGWRFVELLDQASRLPGAQDVRFRFTSPHPKDFPAHLLELIADRPNICNQLHLPAQSGSDRVLERMRRGYTAEAYLELVQRARGIIPGVALSSDFIAGFCGESEEEHEHTLDLIRAVGYDQAYLFAYSLRDRTHAAHKLQDDVPLDIKQRRLQVSVLLHSRLQDPSGPVLAHPCSSLLTLCSTLFSSSARQELINLWRSDVTARNLAIELPLQAESGLRPGLESGSGQNEYSPGRLHLVLVEGSAKKPVKVDRADGMVEPERVSIPLYFARFAISTAASLPSPRPPIP